MTILWHDGESAGYTDCIPEDCLLRDGRQEQVTHDVTGPRSGRYQARCSITVKGTTADLDYRPFKEFNLQRGMLLGVERIQFTTQARETVSQVWWKENRKRSFKPCSTSVALTPDSPEDFDEQVAASSQLSSDERRTRLASAARKPQHFRIATVAYRRNPDVVAEVLFRAGGRCQRCNKPAPFKRSDTCLPYLEVHHKKRLADGGDDTVKNAIALCPNCHREAHYG